ncbi:MFS transporter [Achromobacter sp. Root565]|uniref:MFS transporter n=1 Tax=Achromobacter sp. Root565 TaxID=1736564 RepID=UPI0006F4D7DD|nr:MFS transporter [Achromobacter sp. Root565]KRA01273.1 hypothetical protein ASD71_04060 [Achromobacter sp. Root565]
MTKSDSPAGRIVAIVCATAATYLATSMGGAVSLVLPEIASDLSLSSAQVQWILAGYLLARVGMLKPSGALSDRLGARKMFLVGMTLFAVTSLSCALVSSEALLIGVRILQGAAAAMISPSSLVLLRTCMPGSRQARAMTIWSFAGIAGFGLAPALGGLLVHVWGWPSIFYFCGFGAALFGGLFLIGVKHEDASAVPQGLPPPLARNLLMSTALVVLAYLIGKDDVRGTVYFLVGVLLTTMETERGVLLRAAIWEAGLSRLPAMLAGLSGFASIAAVVLWASYFMQGDLRLSALEFGLSCLPMAATGVISCLIASPLLSSKRADLAFVCGGAVTICAALLAFVAEARSSQACAVAALAAIGLAYGFINGAVSSALLDTFPASQSGDGAAMASLSKQFGQLIGVAIVAAWRTMSVDTPGTNSWFFAFLGGAGAILLASATLSSTVKRPSIAA